jgi:hypothetical protein
MVLDFSSNNFFYTPFRKKTVNTCYSFISNTNLCAPMKQKENYTPVHFSLHIFTWEGFKKFCKMSNF